MKESDFLAQLNTHYDKLIKVFESANHAEKMNLADINVQCMSVSGSLKRIIDTQTYGTEYRKNAAKFKELVEYFMPRIEDDGDDSKYAVDTTLRNLKEYKGYINSYHEAEINEESYLEDLQEILEKKIDFMFGEGREFSQDELVDGLRKMRDLIEKSPKFSKKLKTKYNARINTLINEVLTGKTEPDEIKNKVKSFFAEFLVALAVLNTGLDIVEKVSGIFFDENVPQIEQAIEQNCKSNITVNIEAPDQAEVKTE